MNGTDRAAILAAVYKHAKARWCWDDQTFLEEMVDERYGPNDTPEAFVDELARNYDLTDPHDLEAACRNDYVFSLSLRVFDPDQLREAALAHPDTTDETFLDEEGNVAVGDCLIMLLDPGSIPGCKVYESTAARDEP